MERKIFEHRPRGLFCRRYVDDYIVITNNRRSLVEVRLLVAIRKQKKDRETA